KDSPIAPFHRPVMSWDILLPYGDSAMRSRCFVWSGSIVLGVFPSQNWSRKGRRRGFEKGLWGFRSMPGRIAMIAFGVAARARRSRGARTALAALIVSALAAAPTAATGQEWTPTKPVTLVLATAAGGVADAAARMMQQVLADRLGQPVVVENRPGAAGVL